MTDTINKQVSVSIPMAFSERRVALDVRSANLSPQKDATIMSSFKHTLNILQREITLTKYEKIHKGI